MKLCERYTPWRKGVNLRVIGNDKDDDVLEIRIDELFVLSLNAEQAQSLGNMLIEAVAANKAGHF